MLPLRMLPLCDSSLLSGHWLACCLSKHKGPEMIQDKHTATAAHPGAKVRTTNLLTHTHNTLKKMSHLKPSRLKTGTRSPSRLTKIQSNVVIIESRSPLFSPSTLDESVFPIKILLRELLDSYNRLWIFDSIFPSVAFPP